MSTSNKLLKILDFGKGDRGDMTVFKLGSGFIIQNNDTEEKEPAESLDSLREAFKDLSNNWLERVQSLLQDGGEYDFIDFGFSIRGGIEEEEAYTLDQSDKLEFNWDEIAEAINQLSDDKPLISRRSGPRGLNHITGEQLYRTMVSSRGPIKIRKRIGEEENRGKGTFSPDPTRNKVEIFSGKNKKKFYSDKEKNKNKIPGDKSDNDSSNDQPHSISG